MGIYAKQRGTCIYMMDLLLFIHTQLNNSNSFNMYQNKPIWNLKPVLFEEERLKMNESSIFKKLFS